MPRILHACCLAVLALGSERAIAGPLPHHVLQAPEAGTVTKKQVAVGKIEGPSAAKVRVSLMKTIKDSGWYDVADAEDLKPKNSKATIAKMAGVLGVHGVVMGTVTKKFDLNLAIYKANGDRVEEVVIKGGSLEKLQAAIQSEFTTTVAVPLADATGGYKPSLKVAPPPEMEEEAEPELGDEPQEAAAAAAVEEEAEPAEEAEAEPEEAAAEEEAPKDEKPSKSKPGRTPFELTVGMRGYSRKFVYTDPVGPRDTRPPPEGPAERHLVPYTLPFGPAIRAGARFYPGALVDDGVAGYFGVEGEFELGIATTTELQEPGKPVQELKTSTQSFAVGVRARLPINMVELGIFGMYGSHSFILLGDEGGVNGVEPLVPDVKYDFIRIGADVRARISKFFVAGRVAPRILLSLANIDQEYVWFPGAKGSGLDFGLELGWGFLPYLDVVGGADVLRYGFDFNGIPNENPCDPTLGCKAPVIAGGATDTYISGWLGVRVTLGGGK